MLSSSEKTVWMDGYRSGMAGALHKGITPGLEQRMMKALQRGPLGLSTWDNGYLFGEMFIVLQQEVRARGTEADGGETPGQAPRG